jgi:hypothetical protein
MAADLALLRELGEVSQDSDFLYIGACRSSVHRSQVRGSGGKYRPDQPALCDGDDHQDDVAQVLTQRVVRKEPAQRQRLQELLGEHQQYFPNLAAQLERYVDLFPIHLMSSKSSSGCLTSRTGVSSDLP